MVVAAVAANKCCLIDVKGKIITWALIELMKKGPKGEGIGYYS